MSAITTLACLLFFAATEAVPVPKRPRGDPHMKPQDTDVFTPVPPEVSTPAGRPPSDAVVLYDGHGLDAWQSAKGGPAPWREEDGSLVVVPKAGDIATRRAFGDLQLHLEFREPLPVTGSGQGRGNSGVLLMGLYELQVLDSYHNPTYVNGQAGALYKQAAPLVNASRPPGEWQSYDVIWIAPRFNPDGSVRSPARLTVLHNGVVVQYHTEVKGPTMNQGLPHYFRHPEREPIVLQEHHNPVAYRNIWVRELELPPGAQP